MAAKSSALMPEVPAKAEAVAAAACWAAIATANCWAAFETLWVELPAWAVDPEAGVAAPAVAGKVGEAGGCC